jgi:hypothetical protein
LKEGRTLGLALNPVLRYKSEPERSKGVPYAISLALYPTELNEGLIFAQSKVARPKVVSEGVTEVGATYATLEAQIATGGNSTHYVI